MDHLVRAWKEFEARKVELETLPFKAIVELTQNCNFRCIMCPQSWDPAFSRYHPEYNMPMETFAKIADELFPKAIFIDLRGFGETTILPHWPEVVDYLAKFPFIEWHLVTNLSLPRDETWQKMIQLGFTLGFSCDAGSAEPFERIRRRSRFDTIVHNLEVVSDAIRRENRGLLYFISTIQKSNIQELRPIVELAARHEVHEVQFKIVQPGEGVELLSEVARDVIQRHINECLDAAIALDMRVTFNDWTFTRDVDPAKVARAASVRKRRTEYPFPNKPSFDPTYFSDLESGGEGVMSRIVDSHRVLANQRCFKPFSFTYINYKAQMGTCNHMMYPDMLVMGDLSRQTVAEVWNSPAYRDFRRQLVESSPQDPRCQWCFKHRMDD